MNLKHVEHGRCLFSVQTHPGLTASLISFASAAVAGTSKSGPVSFTDACPIIKQPEMDLEVRVKSEELQKKGTAFDGINCCLSGGFVGVLLYGL